MSSFALIEPSRPPVPMPPARLTSYRYWEDYRAEELRAIRDKLAIVIDDKERQFDLFAAPTEEAPAAAPSPEAKNLTLAQVLSPSQVNTFLTCSAKWWFKYGAGLPDPPSGSLVRGRVVHKMAELYFKHRLAGEIVELDDLADAFTEAWERESDGAAFGKDEDPEELKRSAGVLARKYLEEAAPEIQPAAVEMAISGEIAGVPVRGYIDLMDTEGRIIDLKTAKAKPSGVDPGYAFQLATYRQLARGANGKARIDTVVATKTTQLVTMEYEVTIADQMATQRLYPHVREGMREGLFFPNRGANLCSRKYCNFCDACEKEFGGKVE